MLLSAALRFFVNKTNKTTVVPVLKHDEAGCAKECWVSEWRYKGGAAVLLNAV